jgi:hypothetical protein
MDHLLLGYRSEKNRLKILDYGKINNPCQPISGQKKEVKHYDFNLLFKSGQV